MPYKPPFASPSAQNSTSHATASVSTPPCAERTQRMKRARFVHGNIMRHVVTMAGTGAIGLMSVFFVDLLNFFYISHLNDSTLTAAIAFATSLGYVQVAVSLGMSIGLGANT